MGHKMGMNGVDNGKLWFKNVAVPRSNLLDAYSSVEKGGKFQRQVVPFVPFHFVSMTTVIVNCLVCVAKFKVNASVS
jgi:acyl-CoA oxidase